MLGTLEGIRQAFISNGKQVSLADLIVLGGCAAVEAAAKAAGSKVEVPFTPATDASQEQTDIESFEALEPTLDGCNYVKAGCRSRRVPARRSREPADPQRPEITVLVGGLRVLGANYKAPRTAVVAATPGR